MTFKKFEKAIWEKGYAIVAMNHYTIKNERRTYCVVLNRNKTKAFQAEAKNSEDVFENLYKQIIARQ